MSTLVLNTFDSGVTLAIVGRLGAYLEALGEPYSAKVVPQEQVDPQVLPLVVVSATELVEEIYQSGVYRCGIEVGVRVDMDTGSPDQLRQLTGAVLDFLQKTDLIPQLNAAQDATGRPLCIVQGTVLEQSRLEDIGDRKWQRIISVNVFGCNAAG